MLIFKTFSIGVAFSVSFDVGSDPYCRQWSGILQLSVSGIYRHR